MAHDGYTTVQITFPTKERLRILAKKNKRSMAAHLEWIVEREWVGMKECQNDITSKSSSDTVVS